MGVTAYNRGTALLRRQLDEEMPDHDMGVLRMLNTYPRGNRRLFEKTVARSLNGKWVLMNRKEGGFASFGYEYASLKDMFAVWDVFVTGCGKDKHSFFYWVE